MSFLGAGLRVGGAMAGGAMQGMQQGQQMQAQQQQMNIAAEEEHRREFMADLQAKLGHEKDSREQRKLAIEEQDSASRKATSDSLVKARNAEFGGIGPNDKGIPEDMPRRYAAGWAAFNRTQRQAEQFKAKMAVEWAKLGQDRLMKLHEQKLKEIGQAAQDAAKWGASANATDRVKRDQLNLKKATPEELQRYEMDTAIANRSKNDAMSRKGQAETELKALELHMGERGILSMPEEPAEVRQRSSTTIQGPAPSPDPTATLLQPDDTMR